MCICNRVVCKKCTIALSLSNFLTGVFLCALYTLFRISHFIFCAVHIAHRVVLSVAFRVYTGEDAVAIKTEADSPHDGQLG